MRALVTALDWATTAGFAALGLLAIRNWRREPGRTEAALALVLGLLAVTSLISRIARGLPGAAGLLSTVTILAFELSGVGLLWMRHTLVPVWRPALPAAVGAVGLSVTLFAVAGVPLMRSTPNPAQSVAIASLVIVWAACVGEPTLRLWRAGTGLPTVQRARLRAMSTGCGAIFGVLVISAGPSSIAENGSVEAATAALSLLVIPLLYVSFAPPGWLRRVWRRSEEEAARQGMDELLAFAADPAGLAGLALLRATRLVGADAGAVFTRGGAILATIGCAPDEAAGLLVAAGGMDRAGVVRLPGPGGRNAVVVPLAADEVGTTLVVRSGPFTPLFGSDEVSRLGTYGASVALALDRVRQSMRHQSFLQAVSDIGEGLVITEAGRPIYVNEAYATITGYSPEELMALPNLLDLAPPEMREELVTRLRDRLSGHSVPVQYISQLVRKDGRRIDVENAVRFFEGEGQGKLIAIVRDISDRRRAEELRAMQFAVTRILSDSPTMEDAAPHLLRMISRTLGAGAAALWLLEPDGNLLTMHSWWQPVTVEGAAFDGMHARVHAALGAGVAGRVWLNRAPVIVDDVAHQRELPTAQRAAALGLSTAVGFPVFVDERVTGVLEFFSPGSGGLAADLVDIMADLGRQTGQFIERRRAEQALKESLAQLAEVAATDPLTGLRNRRDFERQLGSLPRRPFALLAIDVDNLKQVNDEFGHEGGDVVLRGISLTLSSLLRGSDVVARVGGDEFAVLLLDANGADAALAGERMRTAVQAISVPYGQARISVGWAAGFAGADPHAAWRRADADLYQAKREGRDRVGRGNADERRGSLLRSAWTERVEHALEERAIPVVYQPIVRLADGAVVAHEALARPTGCGPTDRVDEFFSEALRLGRIRDVDWLCRRMAVESAVWPAPRGWALFINVRTVTLLDPVHDVDQMLLLLESVGGRPEQVVLEITEHEIISDFERLRTVLSSYREHGFRFALDDVGEGHSTLELLAAANAEFIKVARTLTTTAEGSGSRSAILAAMAFAQSSGATMLAEGIENAAVAEQMERFGITLGQGWHLGTPGAIEHRRARRVRRSA